MLAVHKGCFYKVGQFQLCKYVCVFKEFATYHSNASFELCRVVLVGCRFSDHKCKHDVMFTQCDMQCVEKTV